MAGMFDVDFDLSSAELMAAAVYYTSERWRQRNKDRLAADGIAVGDDTAGVDVDVDIPGNMVGVAACDDDYAGVAAGYFDAIVSDV